MAFSRNLDLRSNGSSYESILALLPVRDKVFSYLVQWLFLLFSWGLDHRNKKSDGAQYLRKIPGHPKMGKAGPNLSKNDVFCVLWKFLPLAFPANNLIWKTILLFLFHCKQFFWQNFCSQVMAKMLITNQIAEERGNRRREGSSWRFACR